MVFSKMHFTSSIFREHQKCFKLIFGWWHLQNEIVSNWWHYKNFVRIVLRSKLIFWFTCTIRLKLVGTTGTTIFLDDWWLFQNGWRRTDCWLKLAGTGTTKLSGGLFWGVNSYYLLGLLGHYIFGWLFRNGWWRTDCRLKLAGTGTTKFSGGLFWGVNSYDI